MKVNWAPSTWKTVKIGDVVKPFRKAVSVDPNRHYTEIGIRSHGKGIFYKEPLRGKDLGDKRVFWIEPECFVVNIVFAWEGAVAQTTQAELGMIASHRFPMYKPSAEVLDLDFMTYFFRSKRGIHLLGLASPGGAGRNKTLGQQNFLQLEITLPPLKEQKKIASILQAWNEAIVLTEQRIVATQQRKHSLMQRLLLVDRETELPKHRLASFSERWQQMQFSDVFERVTRKNVVGNDNVLTISAQRGLISQTHFFNKVVASDSLSGYYLLKRGEFAYNKSYSEGYPYGAFKRLNDYDTGVLSTLYVCFCIKEPNVNSDYYVHFFEAGGMNHGIYSIAQEGARNHGLLNMSINDLFNLPIFVPSLEEQNVLAAFFNDLDNEIDLIQQKLTVLRQQKQGLMHQLLTGKIRVKV